MVPRVTGNPGKNTTKEEFIRNIAFKEVQYEVQLPSTAEWQLCSSQKVSQAITEEALK